MEVTARWIRVGIVLVAVGAVAHTIGRLTALEGDHGVLPTISGDTWPPVPVKFSR